MTDVCKLDRANIFFRSCSPFLSLLNYYFCDSDVKDAKVALLEREINVAKKISSRILNVSNVSAHIVLSSLFDIVNSLRENGFESFPASAARNSEIFRKLIAYTNALIKWNIIPLLRKATFIKLMCS